MESLSVSHDTPWLADDVRGYDRLWRKPDTPKTILCAQDDFDFTLPHAQGPVVRLEGLWRKQMDCTFVVMSKPSDPFALIWGLRAAGGKGALHEKVFSHLPQRVHVDWEMMLADFPIEDVEKAHDAVAEALVDSIYNSVQPCDVNDIVLAYSSGKTDAGFKLSFHLYVRNVFYPNTASVAVVVERARQLLLEQGDTARAVARGFDMSVYKGSNHDFRMLGCAKGGRVLRMSPWSIGHRHTDLDTLIQPPHAFVQGCRPALAECTAARTAFPEPADKDAAAAVGMVIAVLGDAFVYTGLSPAGTLVFERRRPSMCEVMCGRMHDNDHIYAFIGDNGAVWLNCRRDASKRRQVGSLCPRPVLEMRVEEANRLREADHPILPQLRDAAHSHETGEELVDFKVALARTNTLCVRAPMGIGKTMGLAAMLREMPSSTKVVALSFRETFTTDFVGKLDGAQDYRHITGAIDLDKTPFVVVQMESLYRLKGTPDLLVLDESEMNIEQFHSSTMDRRRSECYAKFVDLVKHTRQVLALDAKMTMRTIDELQRHGRQVHLAICNRRLQVETKCQVTSNRSAWEASLLDAIARGKNIIIPSGSAAEANIIEKMIQEKVPATKVACFTGATSETVKSECFADVNGTWSQYQVVIYSPTVLAGISFQEQHFHSLFGYFHNRSVTAGGAIQMLGRVRHLIDKEMTVCLCDNPLECPQTEDSIEEFLCSDRFRLLTAQGEVHIPQCIPIELTADGGYVYPYKGGYYRTWIQNMLVVNQSRARFTQTFLSYLAETGVTLAVMPEVEKKKTSSATASHKRSAVRVERDLAEALAKAVDISEEEFWRWCDSGTKDLTDAERLSFQKALLKRAWQYPIDKRVSKKWILAHNRPRTLTVFQNLWTIRGQTDQTVDEVLAEMQHTEQYVHQHANAEHDLHYAFKHAYHDLAIRILRCGLDAPWSEGTVTREQLQAAILTLGPELQRRRKELNQRFERHVKQGQLNSFKQLLGLCGTITSKMYGVKLVTEGKRLFRLKRSDEFDLAMKRITNK